MGVDVSHVSAMSVGEGENKMSHAHHKQNYDIQDSDAGNKILPTTKLHKQ